MPAPELELFFVFGVIGENVIGSFSSSVFQLRHIVL